MTSSLTQLAYVAAAVLFIVGLKRMSHPRTAVQGNVLGITGMGLSILLALASGQLEHHWLVGIISMFMPGPLWSDNKITREHICSFASDRGIGAFPFDYES